MYEMLGEPSSYPAEQASTGDGWVQVSAAVLNLARAGETAAAINQLRAEQAIDLRAAKKDPDGM